jgi:hypothetical protein
MKIYRGRRATLPNHVNVVVHDQDTGRTYQLPGNQHEWEWGYVGAGPARLAEALLHDHDPNFDPKDLGAFVVKQNLVSTMPSESWQLTEDDLAHALSQGMEGYT